MRPRDSSVDALCAAVKAANIPVLLMVLTQLTGDLKWLAEPYRPTRTRGVSQHDSGGLMPEVQQEIRDAAVDAVEAWWNGAPPAIENPRGETLVEMMTVCMGEPIPPDYEPMMAEVMGFTDASMPEPAESAEPRTALIVGAGISGLLAAYRLREAGLTCTVLEKDDHIGGTWWRNRYPGCGVDTPSYLYSYSFFPHEWPTHFGRRDDVMAYVEDMAAEFELHGLIRFGVEATQAAYDAESCRWEVTGRNERGEVETFSASVLVTAVGLLNVPQIPDLPGRESFEGQSFHSAEWPSDVEIDSKRVAVVGTGASAMQIVPAIADRVAELTVFQRSPQWIAPIDDYHTPIGDDRHWLMENVPFYHAWYRFRLAWTFNDKTHTSLQIDPSWEFPDRSINETNEGHRKMFMDYLRRELDGRDDLIAKATPDYPPFGKRMLLDNGWFDALKRPNVALVPEEVTAITASGLRTDSGEEFDFDVIVYATGFQARRFLQSIEITGRDGQTLRELWGDDDAFAYLGITVPGFPNLFVMYGPNTNLGHGGSYIFMAECQIRYIVDLLAKMDEGDIAAVECRSEVCEQYNREVDAAHESMIWNHRGMRTWYRNGAGRVVTNVPWRVVDYWSMTSQADLGDYLVQPRGSDLDERGGSVLARIDRSAARR